MNGDSDISGKRDDAPKTGSESKESPGTDTIVAVDRRRPPLPPRPTTLGLRSRPSASYREQDHTDGLISGPTTAVSITEVKASSKFNGQNAITRSPSSNSFGGRGIPNSPWKSDGEDSSSLYSYVAPLEATDEVRSLFEGNLTGDEETIEASLSAEDSPSHLEVDNVDFGDEFDDLPDIKDDGSNEEAVQLSWKSKQKHFMILSAAGKPIYSRHGSDVMVSGYIGIVQTIISFYQSSKNALQCFSSAGSRFVVLSKNNVFLLAISRLTESDTQLRLQLEALYMQILSTLTLPNLTHIFALRPSSDLRRPLKGTEILLSSLADSFTRGSPSSLLSSLESLKLRKSHREVINNTFLKSRVDDLLYGLIVAGGRLVSVIRPKKHSLHPSDLQLIFNMLFEAEGVKAGGGESWIPLCLPGFNPNGYLYMFVSFLDLALNIREAAEQESISKEEAVAIILISANKESFENMRRMKDYLVNELGRNGSLRLIQQSIGEGRPVPTEIIPGSVLRHFLYKSKANVQFCMPSTQLYASPSHWRNLMLVYNDLHANVHKKHASVKVYHSVNTSFTALAWVTPIFELYCLAGATTGRNALAHNANKIVQWIDKYQERIFIIGGAVF